MHPVAQGAWRNFGCIVVGTIVVSVGMWFVDPVQLDGSSSPEALEVRGIGWPERVISACTSTGGFSRVCDREVIQGPGWD